MADNRELARQKVEARRRAKTEWFYLANDVLGYDFQECHAELFAAFPKWDESKGWAYEQAEKRDFMVLWSRGHYKTTAVVVCIIAAILNFPNIRILLMQGNLKVTRTLLKQVLMHFTGQASGSQLQELFPEFCGDKRDLQADKDSFVTLARTKLELPQPTCAVASPKSIKTGQHYDLGFFDDLVNESNYKNPRLVEEVRQDFTLAQPLIDPGCYRVVSGTRYAFGDLYEEILRWNNADGRWIVSVTNCWSAETANLPDEEKKPRFTQFRKKDGQLGGFTAEMLLQMQADDPAMFACQYLNQPIHSSQQAYTKELLYGACLPAAESPALSHSIMMIDVATTDTQYSDDSVIANGQTDTLGKRYVTDLRGGQWPPMELALNIIDMSLKHRPVKIVFEKSGAGVIMGDYVRLVAKQKGVYLPIDFVKVDTRDDAKNIRVVGYAGSIKRGMVKFFLGLPNFDKLVQQACEFPKGRRGHDDYIDCCALLDLELSKEIMSLPVRRTFKNVILALVDDRENALSKVLTDTELKEVEAPDLTGFE